MHEEPAYLKYSILYGVKYYYMNHFDKKWLFLAAPKRGEKSCEKRIIRIVNSAAYIPRERLMETWNVQVSIKLIPWHLSVDNSHFFPQLDLR